MTDGTTSSKRAVGVAVLMAVGASAQVPIPEESSVCGGFRSPVDEAKTSPFLERREFRIGTSGFCSQYSWVGWEDTMQLYLGEGASEYLSLIQDAVKLWNDALMGFNRQPVISIVEGQLPTNYNLVENFWSQAENVSKELRTDNQSVIYFKGGGNKERLYSFAWPRSNSLGQMVESDIYIDITHEAEHGRNLAYTHKVLEMDETHSAYATVNSTYLKIVHELGHALGVAHVPVSGNVMSYEYMPRMVDIWRAPLALFMSQLIVGLQFTAELSGVPVNYEELPFVHQDGHLARYVVVTTEKTLSEMEVFTSTVALGEQDKMALMCIYDFADWNHR